MKPAVLAVASVIVVAVALAAWHFSSSNTRLTFVPLLTAPFDRALASPAQRLTAPILDCQNV